VSASGNNHVDKNRQQPSSPRFGVDDEVAYALGRGMRYGRVVRVLGTGDTSTVEIEFEDGGREVHKMRDRALSLLRRATGESARDEELRDRRRVSDPEIERLRKSEQRRRS
jgi:hypothetical protein